MMSWLINRALSWEVYVPRHPSHVRLISFQCKPVFRNMRHAKTAMPKNSMTDVGKGYQPRWIRNRLADSLGDPSRFVRWYCLSDLLLRVLSIVDHQIDTHLFFTVRFPAQEVVYFCVCCAKTKHSQSGGQSSSAPLHQAGAIIPIHHCPSLP